ncbi:MAG: ABC transporter ATP-binding protein [Rothia sp. (in: high G+C Gram-positive bacteria)]|nr:ABC transporter ATP-binding protein [Rothia sp. (in: high G+C Gram-positive bacteria)]
MTAHALSITNLHKRFAESSVLSGLNMQVPAGQLVSLLGSSGAGKSTLLRIIAGLEKADEGQVTYTGRPLTPGQVGFVFQQPVLYPHLTVEQNILFASRLKKAAPIDKEHFTSLVDSLGLGQHLTKKPAQLSGGQAQRAGIARALVRKAPVVLFDEPLSSVDEATSASIRADLQTLHRQLGFTGIYVTHHQNEALQMGQQVGVLLAGRLAQLTSPAQLLAAPASLEVARLVFPLYNELEGELAGRRVTAGISAFGFTAANKEQIGALPVLAQSCEAHTAGWKVEGELTASATVASSHGSLTLPARTPLTAVLSVSATVDVGQAIYLNADPAALHTFP